MSDWDDFCASNGWNAGSSADYDSFLGSLEGDDKRIVDADDWDDSTWEEFEKYCLNQEAEAQRRKSLIALRFATFEEAKAWARENIGESIARDPNGPGFMPAQKRALDF